jgi:hypothetical protein
VRATANSLGVRLPDWITAVQSSAAISGGYTSPSFMHTIHPGDNSLCAAAGAATSKNAAAKVAPVGIATVLIDTSSRLLSDGIGHQRNGARTWNTDDLSRGYVSGGFCRSPIRNPAYRPAESDGDSD